MPREPLGDVVGDLQAAIDATNKHKVAIDQLEKDADRRKKVLEEEATADEKRSQRVVDSGGRQGKARKANVTAVEEESAAIEGGARRITADTAAVDANTQAWLANAEARRTAAAVPSATYYRRYTPTGETERFIGPQRPLGRDELAPGRAYYQPGFGPEGQLTAAQRAENLAAQQKIGYLKDYERTRLSEDVEWRKLRSTQGLTPKTGELLTLGQPSEERTLKLWQEQFPGRAPGYVTPGVTGSFGPGRPTLEATSASEFRAIAKDEGAIAEASKARRAAANIERIREAEAAKVPAADKELAASRRAASARQSSLVTPVAQAEKDLQSQAATIRGLTKTQLKTLEEIEAGQTQFSARRRKTIEALRDAGLIDYSAAPGVDRGRGSTGDYRGVRPLTPQEVTPRAAIGGETPEDFHRQELASRALEAKQPLGTAVGDLSPAINATKATEPYREQVAGIEKATQQEKAVLSAKAAEEEAYAEEAQRTAARARQATLAIEEQGPTTLFGGGGSRPPAPPPAGLGGAGGGGGPPEKPPPFKLIAADEEEAAALAARLNAREAEVRDGFNRSGATLAQYSNVLQRHGALTQEFIQGLARGEVTIKEFESQMLTTIGKFGGWVIAGGLVYGAYETIKLFSRGITETQSGVEQLKRSLGEKVNISEAEAGFRRVSKEINVPIGEVARSQFFAARAFPNQQESLEVARTAELASKLDEIKPEDAARAFGSLAVNFKLNAKDIAEIFDILDVGQQKFNARINQTLPQMARAAASFANAGGSAKQLAVQLVELNRVTIAGGTGGGNPATFLTREPANLAKPASEALLRRYGFDPQFAQEHIGDFNEKLQRRAAILPGAPGALGKDAEEVKEAIKRLATSIGGPALGQRYGIPFIAAGPNEVAFRVQEAASKAAGSAQEDLTHKLSQFDERIKALGVTLEDIGSEVGEAGIGKLGTDLVSGLGLVEEAFELALKPLALVAEVITGLPGPLRQFGEGLLIVRGGLRLARSEKGLALRGVVEDVTGGVYGAGSASEILGAQRTQKEIVDRRQRRAESRFAAAEEAQFAEIGAYERLRAHEKPAEEVAALPAGARLKYEERLTELQADAVKLSERTRVAESEALLAQQQVAEASTVLATLMDKRVAGEAKLAAYAAYGGYIAPGGFPNRNPLLAPNQAAADAEASRLGAAARTTPGGVILPVGTQAARVEEGAKTAAQGATGAAPAVESAAEQVAVADSAALTLGSALGSFGTKAAALGGSVLGMATKFKDFIAGLGLLGKGIAAFVAFEAFSDIFGVPGQEKSARERTQKLSEPSSQLDAVKKVEETRKHVQDAINASTQNAGSGFRSPSEIAHTVGYSLQEGRALLDKAVSHVPVIGSFLAGPEERAHDQVIKEREAAEKLQGNLNKGLLSKLGTPYKLGEGELDAAVNQYGQLAVSIEKEGKQGQEASSKVEGLNKHLANQLTLFGTASYGKQAAQLLAGGESEILKRALEHPEKPELLADASTGLSSGLSAFSQAVAKSAKHEAEFARTNKQRQDIIARASSAQHEFVQTLTGASKQEFESRLAGEEGNLLTKEREAIATPLPAKRQKLEAEVAKVKYEILKSKEALKNLAAIANDAIEALSEQLSSIAEGIEIKGIEAHGKLRAARAGGNQHAKESIGIQTEDEVLKAQERNAQGQNKTYIKEAREGKEIEKKEKETVAGLEKVKREAESRALGAGPGSVEKAAAGAQTAREEAEYIKAHAHAFGPEKLADANLKLAQAEKSLGESSISRSQSLSKLATQIAQARNAGNALAQAAAAEAGAAQALAQARTPEEHAQAELDAINARNQRRQAEQAHVADLGALRESEEPNTLEKDRTKVGTLEKELRHATPDEAIKLHASLNDEKRKYQSDKANEEIADIDYREHIRAITSAQGVAELQRVRARLIKAHASRAEIRAIDTKIFDQLNEGQQDFGIGDIKLPTLYDVRRAAQVGTHTPQEVSNALAQLGPPKFEQAVSVTMYVTGGNAKEIATHTVNKLKGTLRHVARKHLKSAGLT